MKKLQLLLPMVLLALFSWAQQKTVTGKVVSKSTHEPLQGVSVHSKDRTVVTDAAGAFSIPANPGDALTLSFVGMNPLVVKVTASTTELSLVMEEGSNDLNMVVVTGYKSEKKVDLTGAVSVVNLAAVKKRSGCQPHAGPARTGTRSVYPDRRFSDWRQW